MISSYWVDNIYHNKIFPAIIVSIIVHSLLVVMYIKQQNNVTYIENGIRAFKASSISISLAKKPEPVPVKPKPVLEQKPEQIQQVVEPIIEPKPVEQVVHEEIEQTAIPFVENASFKGNRTPPIYPKRALMLKQEGLVILHALIDISGIIKAVKLEKSSGYGILDKSAIAAVNKWQFEPSYIDGKPATSWVKVPVEFVIQ